MNTYKLTWTEKHEKILEADSEKEVLELFSDGAFVLETTIIRLQDTEIEELKE